MSEREIEIRGTKWEFDCNFGSWCRSDLTRLHYERITVIDALAGTHGWPLVSKRPVSDAIEEVIALRKRIAEVESERDGWRSDCQTQAKRAEFWRDHGEKHMPAEAFLRAVANEENLP